MNHAYLTWNIAIFMFMLTVGEVVFDSSVNSVSEGDIATVCVIITTTGDSLEDFLHIGLYASVDSAGISIIPIIL